MYYLSSWGHYYVKWPRTWAWPFTVIHFLCMCMACILMSPLRSDGSEAVNSQCWSPCVFLLQRYAKQQHKASQGIFISKSSSPPLAPWRDCKEEATHPHTQNNRWRWNKMAASKGDQRNLCFFWLHTWHWSIIVYMFLTLTVPSPSSKIL